MGSDPRFVIVGDHDLGVWKTSLHLDGDIDAMPYSDLDNLPSVGIVLGDVIAEALEHYR